MLPETEAQNVLNTYTKIASDFADTRYNIWPTTMEFHNTIPEGAQCLDIGCGGGQNITDSVSAIRNLTWYGIDICPEFVKIARDKLRMVNSQMTETEVNNRIRCGDMCNLDIFNDEQFTAIQSIAAFHHLSNVERRQTALRNMWRILKPGGYIYITVWAANRIVGNKRSKLLQLGDNIIPWGVKKIPRYYYIFNENELENLIRDTCLDAVIIKKFWDHGNHIIRFKKPEKDK